MVEEEILRVIQSYRHDLMNRLQIVSGYLSMDKIDKAKKNLENILQFYEEERKLMKLHVPAFALWILQFHKHYPTFLLTYCIHLSETDEHQIDEKELLSICQGLLHYLEAVGGNIQVYEVFLKIVEETDKWTLSIHVKDFHLGEEAGLDSKVAAGLQMIQTENGLHFKYNIAKSERGE